MTSTSDVRIECNRLGLSLEDDKDSQCYRATAPEGRRFEPDLHELIAVYGGGFVGNGAAKVEARIDLLGRLRDYRSLEPCDNPDCDWCHPVPDPADT